MAVVSILSEAAAVNVEAVTVCHVVTTPISYMLVTIFLGIFFFFFLSSLVKSTYKDLIVI